METTAIDCAISAVYNCIDPKLERTKSTILLALMKQVPLKVIKKSHYFSMCPVCSLVLDRTTNYCEKCGQKLDYKED